MRHLQAVVLALASGVVGCCGLTGPSLPSMPMSDARLTTEAAMPGKTILLDVAMIERPAGDAFLNQDLWNLGDEQCIDLETKPTLEANGLRVAQITGLLPARLQALLASRRSCPDPRRLEAQPEEGTPLQIGSHARLTFQVHQGEQKRQIDLLNADCFLEVTATADNDQELHLRFTPRIRHGTARIEPRVARDNQGTLRWSVECRDPIEDIPEVSWELTLSPEAYMLVGARLERTDTLGTAYFLDPRGQTQRLMVIRAYQVGGDRLDDTLHQAPPLALQATWTARGSRR